MLFRPHSLDEVLLVGRVGGDLAPEVVADRADPRIAGEFPPDRGRGDALPAQDGRPAAAAHANERQVQVARHGLSLGRARVRAVAHEDVVAGRRGRWGIGRQRCARSSEARREHDQDQERETGGSHLSPSYDGRSFSRDTLDVTGGSYGRVMEAHIIPLHPTVRLEGDRIVIEGLSISDPALAAFLGERQAAEREALAERALRIGLLALQDVGVTVNVDAVRTEFERMMRQAEQVNERAATALEQTLRANFADGDGRLPRTLEKFLGDRGALRSMVDELFDEKKRDSAIGRIGTMLERYFDGDASKLAHLLDPTRLNSPMHQFRQEIAAGFKGIEERLVAIEAAAAARGAERARSAAKGIDFEDLIDAMLGDIARGSGDMVDRTTLEAGTVMRSKKGDFVLTIDPTVARGCDLRVVIEAKDRPMSTRQMRDELREARENRGAAVAVVVFTPAHAPRGVAPFTIAGGDVYCVIDPDAPEPATLEAAIRLARLLALATLAERDVTVDAAAIAAALVGIREQLELVRQLKSQLTSISTATKTVWTGLDEMRAAILTRVTEAEAEIRTTAS